MHHINDGLSEIKKWTETEFAGRFTLPAFSAYSMSKKACIAFSDGLRLEMNKFDVKVITIEPGLYRYS